MGALPERSTDVIADVRALAGAVAEVKRALARGTIPGGDGPPADAGQPDFTIYADRANRRLYVRLAGVWRWVALT